MARRPASPTHAFAIAVVALLVLASAALVSRLGGDPLVAAASAGILAHGWLLAAGFVVVDRDVCCATEGVHLVPQVCSVHRGLL